jgi:hypothetical protein
MDVAALADALAALTDPAVADDPRKNMDGAVLSTSDVGNARALLSYRVESYSAWLREAMGL